MEDAAQIPGVSGRKPLEDREKVLLGFAVVKEDG
jgi:hypothetical protein